MTLRRPHRRNLLVALAVLGVIGAVLTGTAMKAAATSRVVVTGQADISVWLDGTRDVYADYDDVVVSLRATRDCYATVFVIDTDGYVHIVRPLSPWDRAWIRGGHTYRYTGRELGLAWLPGRGIAHIFAVSSPHPFDYSTYGEAIFAGQFGFRVYGDPFVACREIYISLLPANCGPGFVSVSFARFYIREWTRYPGYLCRGHGGLHVRVGDYCRHCAHIYDGYRVHVADPYPVIHPRSTLRKRMSSLAEVRRSTVKYKSRERREAVAGWSRNQARKSTGHPATGRVVSRKSTHSTRSKSVAPERRIVSTKRIDSRRVETPRKKTSLRKAARSAPKRAPQASVKNRKSAQRKTAVRSSKQNRSKSREVVRKKK